MQIIRLRGACDPKPTCPALYLTDRATFVVQGWIVNPPSPLPAYEAEGEDPRLAALDAAGRPTEEFRSAADRP